MPRSGLSWTRVTLSVLANIVSVAVIVALLWWATRSNTNPPNFYEVLGIAILPGMPIGLIFSVFASLLLQLNKEVKKLNEINKKNEELRLSNALLEPYTKIHKIINNDNNNSTLVNILLKKAMDAYHQIAKTNARTFYQILTEGLTNTSKWEGIHHGFISHLGDKLPDEDYGTIYLNKLNKVASRTGKPRIKAQRVIIVPDASDELGPHSKTALEEIQDFEIMDSFWKRTGRQVRSYFVYESQINSVLQKNIAQWEEQGVEFHDCALYDSTILLHFERESDNKNDGVITIAFEKNKSTVFRPLLKIFEELEIWKAAKKPTPRIGEDNVYSPQFREIDRRYINALKKTNFQVAKKTVAEQSEGEPPSV